MDWLDILSNRFGGRMPGSDAYTHAAQWTRTHMQEWGMQAELEDAGQVSLGFNRAIQGEVGTNRRRQRRQWARRSGNPQAQRHHEGLDGGGWSGFRAQRSRRKLCWSAPTSNRDARPGAVSGITIPSAWKNVFARVEKGLERIHPVFAFAPTIDDTPRDPSKAMSARVGSDALMAYEVANAPEDISRKGYSRPTAVSRNLSGLAGEQAK